MATLPDCLEERLQHYDLTAGSRSRPEGDWTFYAAATGAALALAGNAEAAVIYSGVRNLTAAIDPTANAGTASGFNTAQGFHVDMDNDGFVEVNAGAFLNAFARASAGGTTYSVWDEVSYRGGAFVSGPYLLGTGVYARRLNSGAMIGNTPYWFGGYYNGRLAAFYGTTQFANGYVRGNAPVGENFFIGVQLSSGNYGWIRLRFDDLGPNQPLADFNPPKSPYQGGVLDQVTVIDWAWQDSGAAIAAGQLPDIQAVPEPSPLALLAAGAVGVGMLRRQRNQASSAQV